MTTQTEFTLTIGEQKLIVEGDNMSQLKVANGERRVSSRIGGTMEAWIRIAILVTLTECGTIALSAQEPKPTVDQSRPVAGNQASDDNMTPYRKLATDTLQAFKARDMPTAKKKARELEVTWDTHEKALQKKSPDLWGQIDKAMDAFIKPVQDKSSDPAKVQTAYDAFLAKLQLAGKSDSEPKR
jgi:hypothetical protein